MSVGFGIGAPSGGYSIAVCYKWWVSYENGTELDERNDRGRNRAGTACVGNTSRGESECFKSEIDQKVAAGLGPDWDDIKDNPPPKLKISPLALVPRKSRKFRAILDLSFRLRLKSGDVAPSVNENSEKMAPKTKTACEQLGQIGTCTQQNHPCLC